MNSIYTLETWLQIATNDLTPEAVVNIRKEITDHVKTTLERQTSAGLSQVEAEKVAVTLLGDPKKSAKKFNRVHLTKKDEEALQSMRKKVILYIVVGLGMLWLPGSYFLRSFQFIYEFQVGFLSYFFGIQHFYFLIVNLYYITWSILILTSSFIVLNLKNISKIKSVTNIQSILFLLSSTFVITIVTLMIKKLVKNEFDTDNTLYLIYLFNFMYYGFSWFSFYRKIRKISTRASS